MIGRANPYGRFSSDTLSADVADSCPSETKTIHFAMQQTHPHTCRQGKSHYVEMDKKVLRMNIQRKHTICTKHISFLRLSPLPFYAKILQFHIIILVLCNTRNLIIIFICLLSIKYPCLKIAIRISIPSLILVLLQTEIIKLSS